MTDQRSSITVYSKHLSVADFEQEASFILEEMDSEKEIGLGPSDTPRYLFLQGNHGSWVQEKLGPFLENLMERRTSITRIEWRQEDRDAQYDEVMSARVLRRGEPWQVFTAALIPDDTFVRVTTLKEQRNRGENAAAWLTAMSLIEDIETGATL